MAAFPGLVCGTTIERGVMMLGALRPLMGSRSTGALALAATSAPVKIDEGLICFPTRTGTASTMGNVTVAERDLRAPFRTLEEKTISSTGGTIQIGSILGGAAMNLPQDTPFAFWPPIDGLDVSSVKASANLTGAISLDVNGAIKHAVFYEMPDAGDDLPDDLMRSMLGQLPAVLLSWTGSPPATRQANVRAMRQDRWTFTIITGRPDGSLIRSWEGLTLLDLIEGLLVDRGTIDRVVRVSEPGIKLEGRGRRFAGPGFSAHTLMFSTFTTIENLIVSDESVVDGPTFAAWVKTLLRSDTMADETGTHPGKLTVAGPGTYPQG